MTALHSLTGYPIFDLLSFNNLHVMFTVRFLWILVAGLLITGLIFPPLMDNDAAEYASIALKMHLDQDYANIINRDYDYLDKPHMLFWSAALAYKIFGITAFSYRIVSVLVCLLGAFATYRLGRLLYNQTVGEWAALIFITAEAIILANHDVRTDTLLVGLVTIGVWLATEFIHSNKLVHLIGAASALALGVATKGMIAVIVAGCLLFFYILLNRKWRILTNPRWLIGLFVFGAVLSPFLLAYYFQFDLHPEKLVNGRHGVSGVKFLLWDQSFERFAGDRNFKSNSEFLFFHHSFLWAFLPWSFIAILAFIDRIKKAVTTSGKDLIEKEQITFVGVLTMFTIMSFSSFKLPHYINVLFPFIAIATAAYLHQTTEGSFQLKAIKVIQIVIQSILIIAIGCLSFFVFPLSDAWIVIFSIGLLGCIVFCYRKMGLDKLQHILAPSVLAIVLVNFVLNTNFYPALGKYQAGSMLSQKVKELGIPDSSIYVFYQKYRSFDFYSKFIHKKITLEEIRKRKSPFYLVIRDGDKRKLQSADIDFQPVIAVPDYRVTQLKLKFLNPSTRDRSYSQAHIVKISND